MSSDCEEPFVFSECGSVCEKHCDLLGETDSCVNCTPGCFCPEVSSHHTHTSNVFDSVRYLHYNADVCFRVSCSRTAHVSGRISADVFVSSIRVQIDPCLSPSRRGRCSPRAAGHGELFYSPTIQNSDEMLSFINVTQYHFTDKTAQNDFIDVH